MVTFMILTVPLLAVITPLAYNKSELRKCIKEVQDGFKAGAGNAPPRLVCSLSATCLIVLCNLCAATPADADIDDDKLGSCGEKELNKRSQIKNKVNEAIDK